MLKRDLNLARPDDVYNALAPLLPKHGLVVVPRMLARTCTERTSMLAMRVARLVALRRSERAKQCRVALQHLVKADPSLVGPASERQAHKHDSRIPAAAAAARPARRE